jgi:hypothetical protein
VAYVTRVRRERLSVDELVRRVQAEGELSRRGAPRRRRCRLSASGAVVAFGVVVVFLASCGRAAETPLPPDVRPPSAPATAAGR